MTGADGGLEQNMPRRLDGQDRNVEWSTRILVVFRARAHMDVIEESSTIG
jgi:hypothetical protein